MAIANSCYEFVNWTKNGVEVSKNNPYSFTVTDSDYQISDIRLFDVMGRQISIVGQSEIGKSEIVINIAHLPVGIYFIRIQTENGVITRKVVKE